jgi:integrase
MNTNWVISHDRFLDREDVQKLLKTLKQAKDAGLFRGRKVEVKDYYVISTFLQTGLRLMELIALNVEDILLKKSPPCVIVQHGKCGKKRNVYITQEFKTIIQEYLEIRKQWGEPESGRLFLSTRGTPYCPRAIQKRVKQCFKGAGLDQNKLSVHSLRHTYVTQLLKQSKNLVLTQQQCGHSNVSITSHYLHLVQDDIEKLPSLYD